VSWWSFRTSWAGTWKASECVHLQIQPVFEEIFFGTLVFATRDFIRMMPLCHQQKERRAQWNGPPNFAPIFHDLEITVPRLCFRANSNLTLASSTCDDAFAPVIRSNCWLQP